MPKNEVDPEDPMELSGVALFTDEDTSEAMCECFIEEYMRMGYDHRKILSLFHTPFFLAMNMVLQNKGETFIRARIEETFARWGRPVVWEIDARAADQRPGGVS